MASMTAKLGVLIIHGVGGQGKIVRQHENMERDLKEKLKHVARIRDKYVGNP
jgi:hypothetical protein